MALPLNNSQLKFVIDNYPSIIDSDPFEKGQETTTKELRERNEFTGFTNKEGEKLYLGDLVSYDGKGGAAILKQKSGKYTCMGAYIDDFYQNLIHIK